MRINRMHLIAYGPFSDTTLDFAGRQAAFHLVYGPNEAGKSSALRALRNLLFGIPLRTPDSFRHPHPKLRIGAELVRRDGETLRFIRRKGLRKTLRGPDDRSPLAEDALASFLGNADRDLFEQMFAIDHQDLVQGGEEIIAGGGRVGQALFAAGAGLVHLQQLQQRLDETLETLFKPGGSKPRINRTTALLKEARQQQKEALLLAKTWQTHHNALQDAQARQAANRQRLVEHQKALASLERIHQALPLIARRREILDALPELADIPDLADDFEDRRRSTENTLTMSGNDVERARRLISDLQQKISLLAVPEALLQQASLVEELQHELGSFRKAMQDRPALEARRRTLSQQAATRLAQLGLADLTPDDPRLLLTPAGISDIQDLAQTHERLKTRLEATRQRSRELESEKAAIEKEKQSRPMPRDVTALKAILQDALDAGPLEKQLSDTGRAWAEEHTALINRLQRQSLWSGPPEALETLPLPVRESIDRFEEQMNASLQHIERLREDLARTTDELAGIRTELRIIANGHDVPTEADLAEARRLRDTGWHLIRRQLEGHGNDEGARQAFTGRFSKNASLADAFQSSLDQTDHLADRLRREAEQVSRKNMLEARQHQTEEKRHTLDRAIDAARTAHGALNEKWQILWTPAGIAPRSPAEMRGWLADMTAIRDRTGVLQGEQLKNEALVGQIDHWKSKLQDALAPVNLPGEEPLSKLIDRARREVASQEELGLRVERLDQTLRQLRREIMKSGAEKEALERDMQAWQDGWGRVVTTIGLPADARPAAALATIESIRETRTYQDEADVLQKRIQGIDRDADVFRRRVARLVGSLAPELSETSAEEAAVLLNAKLTEGRSQQSRLASLQQQLGSAREDQARARRQLEEARARMASLCRTARCAEPAELPAIERHARQRKALLQAKGETEDRLRHLSAGATVETFVREAAAVDPDSLAPEMARLEESIAVLEEERSVLDQTIGTARAELRRMDGRADAADHAEEAEHLLASLESLVEQYARTKIAAVLLARTIEQYREKHQGPLIERASALFRRMTREAFLGIRAEYDEKGHPVLVGIRTSPEEAVGIDGMSDGTADQLYLALRLASLERYLDRGEPLPFVVDDILLRFDDERALATLEVLMDLAARTQVIFFTHHRHLVTLAQGAFDATQIDVIPLPAGLPPAARN